MTMYKILAKRETLYEFEIEANSEEEAEKQGWNYEDYPFHGSVYSIEVEEQEEYEED